MSALSPYIYLVTPFITWLITGICKFCVNSVRAKQLAMSQIGYGGFPSNHSAIVSSMAALIAFKHGLDHPAFGVALTLAFIVVMDANSLRMKIAQHAQHINQLNQINQGPLLPPLRERIGHSKIEILGGIGMGILCALLMHNLTA
ncbi:MAG: divergent PAP2 family protein [Pseudomonadota bacterium]